jgi:hypothetical protein
MSFGGFQPLFLAGLATVAGVAAPSPDGWQVRPALQQTKGSQEVACRCTVTTPSGPREATVAWVGEPPPKGRLWLTLSVEDAESIADFPFASYEGPSATAKDHLRVAVTTAKGLVQGVFTPNGWFAAERRNESGPYPFVFQLNTAYRTQRSGPTLAPLARAIAQGASSLTLEIRDEKLPDKVWIRAEIPLQGAASLFGKWVVPKAASRP